MQRFADIKRTQLRMLWDRGYDIRTNLGAIYQGRFSLESMDQNLINSMLEYLDENVIAGYFLYARTYWNHPEAKFKDYIKISSKAPSDRDLLSWIYSTRADPTDTAYVRFLNRKMGKSTISKDSIAKFIKAAIEFGARRSILVSDDVLGTEAKRTLDEFMYTYNHKVEMFAEADLTYSPLLHVDVPTHVRLDPAVAVERLRGMRAIKARMLFITKNDPIVRYFGWEVGDVIEIQRNDIDAGILTPRSTTYRTVIEPPVARVSNSARKAEAEKERKAQAYARAKAQAQKEALTLARTGAPQ